MDIRAFQTVKIIYYVCTLCRDHQKAGFVDGVKAGMRLREELAEK